MRGKVEAAKAFLVKHHGDGHTTPSVAREFEMMQAGAIKKSRWNYKAAFKSRGHRYRLMLGESWLGAFD